MKSIKNFKTSIILVLSFFFVICVSAQTLSFNEMLRSLLSAKAQQWLDNERQNPSFVEANIIHLNNPVQYFKDNKLLLNIGEKTYQLKANYRNKRTALNLSWSGLDNEGNAFIFSINKNKLLAKFYHEDYAYTLYPLGQESYALIAYDLSQDESVCGTGGHRLNDHGNGTSNLGDLQNYQRAFSSDDDCNLRVLVYVTDDAISELAPGVSAADLTQLAIDESNTAYVNSGVNFGMELAAVLSTDYAEDNSFVDDPDGGFCLPKDLFDIKNGNGEFSNVPNDRNTYDADVVILIRKDGYLGPDSSPCSGANGIALAGIAYYVPTYNTNNNINADFAFAVSEHTGITVGRYTFPHEIGHLQGARHQNDNRAPAWGIGIINNTNAGGRSIMATAGACNNCRTQAFAGPNSTIGGVNNDNVRRMNETRDTILGHRVTPNFLILGNEEFESGFKSNHLAKISLTTSTIANITANNGSEVTFRAGTTLEFNPGFTAKAGANVRAYVQGSACEVLPEIDP